MIEFFVLFFWNVFCRWIFAGFVIWIFKEVFVLIIAEVESSLLTGFDDFGERAGEYILGEILYFSRWYLNGAFNFGVIEALQVEGTEGLGEINGELVTLLKKGCLLLVFF